MEIVLKRDGRKEGFSADKIISSVNKVAKDAKLAPARFLKEVAEPTIEYFKKIHLKKKRFKKL